MRSSPRIAFLAAILVMSTWCGPELAGVGAAAKGRQTDPPPKPTVYVSDFEIDVLPPEAGQGKPEDDPRRLAARLGELMSTKLVAALRKGGYTAARLHRGDARPDTGLPSRGVSPELHAENDTRRPGLSEAAHSRAI